MRTISGCGHRPDVLRLSSFRELCGYMPTLLFLFLGPLGSGNAPERMITSWPLVLVGQVNVQGMFQNENEGSCNRTHCRVARI